MTYPEFLKEWRDTSDAVEVRTSGSTGAPKRMMLSKEVMRQSALRSNRFFGITSGSRLHSCISPDFIGGKMMAVRSETAGCLLTYEHPTNEPEISRRQGAVDLVSVVPSQMVYILDHPEDYSHVRRFLVGGSPIPVGMGENVDKRGMDVWESYGMTETASHIALRKVTARPLPFYPLPGITVSVDGRGCLVIRGAAGADGADIITNDIAEILPDGGFNIIGRADNVIISGGKKIHPEVVEREIRRITGVTEPMVLTGEPDSKWGSRLTLWIERAEMDSQEARRLMALMHEGLESWECPKEINVVETLPRTPNGKLLRKIK